MKKLLLIAMSVSLLLFSCKKDEADSLQLADKKEAIGSEKTFKVQFKSSDIKVKSSFRTIVPVQQCPVGDKANFLKVVVLTIGGNPPFDPFYTTIDTVSLTKKNGKFEDAVFDLPAGEYKVVFIASNENLPLGNLGESHTSPTLIYSASANAEIFTREIDLVVVDSPVKGPEVVLERKIAQVEINFEDRVPENIENVSVTYKEVQEWRLVFSPSVLTRTVSRIDKKVVKTFGASEIGKKNTKLYIYLLAVLGDDEAEYQSNTFNLQATFKNSGVASQKLITIYSENEFPFIIRDNRVRLSGTIFDPSSTSPFSISSVD